MKKTNFKSVLFISFVLLFSTLILSGCGSKDRTDDYGNRMIESDKHVKLNEETPSPNLSSSDILVVRLVYDFEYTKSSDTDWYKVSLKRSDKNWSDSVKIEGIIRSENRHYDDFKFGSKNFNLQLERKEYDINTLDGYYDLTITGSGNYERYQRLHFKNGKWTNTNPVLTFNVR